LKILWFRYWKQKEIYEGNHTEWVFMDGLAYTYIEVSFRFPMRRLTGNFLIMLQAIIKRDTLCISYPNGAL
jgi:hypothetical protein